MFYKYKIVKDDIMTVKMTLLVYEVFERFEKLKTKQEKISCLQQHNSHALQSVLRGTFDDKVQWLLPAGDPPYTPAQIASVPSNLLKQHTKFLFFVKGVKQAEDLPPFKRERIFLDMLETIHPEDAQVLLKMKDKKPPAKGLTKKLVQEAFPNLISG